MSKSRNERTRTYRVVFEEPLNLRGAIVNPVRVALTEPTLLLLFLLHHHSLFVLPLLVYVESSRADGAFVGVKARRYRRPRHRHCITAATVDTLGRDRESAERSGVEQHLLNHTGAQYCVGKCTIRSQIFIL